MKQLKNFSKDWLLPIFAAIILATLINKFVFFNITVPSGSMYPTIKIGDKITVTKVYNKSKLKRGDIIVFYSYELKMRLVKRLIGKLLFVVCAYLAYRLKVNVTQLPIIIVFH